MTIDIIEYEKIIEERFSEALKYLGAEKTKVVCTDITSQCCDVLFYLEQGEEDYFWFYEVNLQYDDVNHVIYGPNWRIYTTALIMNQIINKKHRI